MNIILTGVTGTLGSRILYELVINKFDSIKKIYLLVRKKGKMLPEERIQRVLQSHATPVFIQEHLKAIHTKVQLVHEIDFLNPSAFLNSNDENIFIHSAGYVNLSIDPSQEEEIFNENYNFTKRLFTAYKGYISKFTFISTAFSIGDIGGQLQNDYTQINESAYRNYYEKSKHETEKYLINEAKESTVKVQVLRPSVLGGNVLDTPNFFVSKYMVFYLFAKFFQGKSQNDIIRIAANGSTSLNIIPTDYAAKVIAKVFDQDIPQLNIVHSKGTNIIQGISKILNAVDFHKFTFTSDAIQEFIKKGNALEQLYYQTIGIHLHPYLTSRPYEWDTKLLEEILPIPKYDVEEYLVANVLYAKTKNFRSERW